MDLLQSLKVIGNARYEAALGTYYQDQASEVNTVDTTVNSIDMWGDTIRGHCQSNVRALMNSMSPAQIHLACEKLLTTRARESVQTRVKESRKRKLPASDRVFTLRRVNPATHEMDSRLSIYRRNNRRFVEALRAKELGQTIQRYDTAESKWSQITAQLSLTKMTYALKRMVVMTQVVLEQANTTIARGPQGNVLVESTPSKSGKGRKAKIQNTSKP